MFFEATGGTARHLAHFEWLTVCHVSGADLVKQGELSGAHVDMWHLLIGWKIQSGLIKCIRKSNEPMMAGQVASEGTKEDISSPFGLVRAVGEEENRF